MRAVAPEGDISLVGRPEWRSVRGDRVTQALQPVDHRTLRPGHGQIERRTPTILTTLPLDEERHAEAAVQLAFAVHVAHHPRLAAIRRLVDHDVRQALVA